MAMKNFNYCMYTYLHRRSLYYYIKNCEKLGKLEKTELLKRVKIHDMDKMALYLFWEKKAVSDYHRKSASHHIKQDVLEQYSLEEFETSYQALHADAFDEANSIVPLNILIDMLESVFDYECAALTKSDKPMNAFDTCQILYPEIFGYYEIILKALDMNSSYCAINTAAIQYINTIDVTPENILMEVARYFAENKNNVYNVLGSIMCFECEYLDILSYYNQHCFNVFKKFFVNYKEFSKIYISEEMIESDRVPFLELSGYYGKLISFKNKTAHFYYFVSVDGYIHGRCFSEKKNVDDIIFLEYCQPMIMQLAEEEYQCSCGNKFHHKQRRCSYCYTPLIY